MLKKSLVSKKFQTSSARPSRPLKPEQGVKEPTERSFLFSAFSKANRQSNNVAHLRKKSNMNDEILVKRRESMLNSRYNQRFNLLKSITKENQKIYQRISSQKSMYCQQDLRKSSVSVKSVSSRSSSRVSSSQKSIKASNRYKTGGSVKSHQPLNLKPQSVDNLKRSSVEQFRSVFFPKRQESKENVRPQFRKQNRSLSVKDPNKLTLSFNRKSVAMGSLLHRIAEEMFEKPTRRKGIVS